MKRIARILVTHDFSEGSKLALDYGIEYAMENGAQLHFMHVEVLHDALVSTGEENKTKGQVLYEKLRGDILKSIEKQSYRYADLKGIRYTVARDVAAAPAIVAYGKEHNIDLIIMGTHGRRGLKHKLLGSVTEEVIRFAPCTVFAVREQTGFKSLEQHLNLITVPIDFSDHSRAALSYAKELAAEFDATLNLVHVVEEKVHPIFHAAGVFSVYDMHPEIEETVLAELKKMVETTKGPGVPIEYSILRGNPAAELVRWTEEKGGDLVVISTHGLAGIDHAILGSVTEKIIRRAPCPVIVVKYKEQKIIQDTTKSRAMSGV
ncbi:MAG: universal stress protein [Rhodothermales bacterium]